MDKTLHETLIDEILSNPQTPKEHAAANEIKALREKLAKIPNEKADKGAGSKREADK